MGQLLDMTKALRRAELLALAKEVLAKNAEPAPKKSEKDADVISMEDKKMEKTI